MISELVMKNQNKNRSKISVNLSRRSSPNILERFRNLGQAPDNRLIPKLDNILLIRMSKALKG